MPAEHGQLASYEIESWTIAPGLAGPQTFCVSGEETDSFRGQTENITNEDTGIPALPGHYSTSDIFGFSAPGIAGPNPGRFPASEVAAASSLSLGSRSHPRESASLPRRNPWRSFDFSRRLVACTNSAA